MRIPYSWLREYCDPGVEVAEIAERLVMTGTEVERIGVVGPPSPEGFVVGKVLSAEQHPNADRLRVCRVDTGDGEQTIVCGAPNVAAGQTVAVAQPGSADAGRREAAQGEAAGGRLGGDDPLGLRARSRRRRRRHPRARGRAGAGNAAGRGAAAGRAGAGAGGDAEPLGLLRDLGRRPRGPRDLRRRRWRPSPGARTRRPRAGETSTTSPRSRSRSPSSARASPPAPSPTSRSFPRRSGCRRA